MRLNKDFMLVGLFSCCLGVVCLIDHLTNSSMQRPQKSRRVLSIVSTTPSWTNTCKWGKKIDNNNLKFCLKAEGNTYQYRFENSYRVLAFKLLVVCEPVDQLHDQWFKELSGYLEEKHSNSEPSAPACLWQPFLWVYIKDINQNNDHSS